MNFFKRLFCKHDYELIRPVYGDMKNYYSGHYKCKKCGKDKLK